MYPGQLNKLIHACTIGIEKKKAGRNFPKTYFFHTKNVKHIEQ